MRNPLIPTAALLALLPIGQALAQIVDETDIRREGADAVLQVRFATEVQFQRSITTRSGDLMLVTYNLLTTTNNQLQKNDQVLRLRPGRGLPDIESLTSWNAASARAAWCCALPARRRPPPAPGAVTAASRSYSRAREPDWRRPPPRQQQLRACPPLHRPLPPPPGPPLLRLQARRWPRRRARRLQERLPRRQRRPPPARRTPRWKRAPPR